MIKLALKNDPVLLFLAPLIIVVGTVIKLIIGVELPSDGHWDWIVIGRSWSAGLNYSLSSLVAILVALFLNQMVQSLGLLGRITNITMVVFAMFYFSIPDEVNHWSAWLVTLIQLWLFRMVEITYDQTKRIEPLVFNMGVAIGLTALLIPPGVVLFLVLIHALVVSGNLNVRRIIVGILGAVAPIYFYASLAYLFRWTGWGLSLDVSASVFSEGMTKLNVLGIAFLVFMTIIAAISTFSISSSTTLRERRRWILVISYLFMGGLMILIEGFKEPVFIAIVPATVVLTRTMLSVRNAKVANAILLVFLAFVLLINS